MSTFKNTILSKVTVFSLLLVLLFGFAVVGETTITQLAMAGEISESISKIAKQYNKTHEGVTVEVVAVPWSKIQQKANLDFAVGRGNYDALTLQNNWMARPVKNGHLKPLGNIINKEEVKWSDFTAPEKEFMTFNDKIYGIPQQGGSYSLYARSDLFEDQEEQENFKEEFDYEMPKPGEMTWKQFQDVAEFFTRPDEDMWGLAINGKMAPSMPNLLLAWLRSYGMTMFGEDWVPNFDNETVVNYYEMIKRGVTEWAPAGARGQTADQARGQFLQGKAAMHFGWAGVKVKVRTPGQSKITPEQLIQISSPKGDVPEGQHSTFSIIWGNVLSKYSENPEATYEWMKYLTLHDKEYLFGGGIPVRPSTFNDPEVKEEYPEMVKTGEIMTDVISWPRITNFRQVADTLAMTISKVISDQLTPKEAAERAQVEVTKLMEDAGYIS